MVVSVFRVLFKYRFTIYCVFSLGIKTLTSQLGRSMLVSIKSLYSNPISASDQRLVQRTRRDVKKVAPLVIVFLIPIVGWIAPLLAPIYFRLWPHKRPEIFRSIARQVYMTHTSSFYSKVVNREIAVSLNNFFVVVVFRSTIVQCALFIELNMAQYYVNICGKWPIKEPRIPPQNITIIN